MLNSISSDRRNTAPSIFTRGGWGDRGPESRERGAESASGQSGRGVERLVGIQGLRKHAGFGSTQSCTVDHLCRKTGGQCLQSTRDDKF